MARSTAIRTQRQYDQLAARQRATYARTVQARRLMRTDGLSLRAASRLAGTTPRSVRRYAGSDLANAGGRIVSTRDRAYRAVNIVTNRGVAPVAVSRRDASTAGGYLGALGRYLATGDDSELQQYHRTVIAGMELETDLDAIDERYARGELDDLDAIDERYARDE